jgi:hypothetical protein
MACDLPAPDRRAGINKRRVGFAVMAGTLAAVAIALDTTQVASLLFLGAGLIFAAGFGIPVATAAEGGPPIGKLVVALFDREHERLTRRALEDRLLDTLTVVTGDVTLHEPRAIRLVGQAVEQAAARWRGPIGPALQLPALLRRRTRGAGPLGSAHRSRPPAGSSDSLWRLGCQGCGWVGLTGTVRRPRLAGEGEGRLVAP